MPTILLAGYRLPMKAERILKEILESAGLSSARISDTTRDFDQQAKVIVDYYNLNGAAAAKKLYGHGPGGVAIGIYERRDKQASLAGVLDQMAESMRTAIATERKHGGQRHLMHTSETHIVFDVAPTSISDKEAFVREAAKHPGVSRFLHPRSSPPDKVFHLEIPN